MITTSYGTWCTEADHSSTTVEDSVLKAFGSYGPEAFDFEAIVSGYREAINEALPSSVSLCGNEFIGPVLNEQVTNDELIELIELDIKSVVDNVDFWAIVAKHEIAED